MKLTELSTEYDRQDRRIFWAILIFSLILIALVGWMGGD